MENSILTEHESNKTLKNINQYINDNQGLVWKIARTYSVKNDFDIEDLVQEGNIGLIKAINKYDSSKGTKLSTYSVFWINHYINQYVKRNKTNTISLDEPIYNDDEITRINTIEDDSQCPEDETMDKMFYKQIRDLINNTLNLEEQEVVRMRYGFYTDCLTFDQIGEIIDKSKMGAKKVNDKAINKLRRTPFIQALEVERAIDKNVENYSKRILNTEAAAINEFSTPVTSLKVTDNKCIGNEPFYKWYRNNLKQHRKLMNELEKISKNDYIINRIYMKYNFAYDDVILKRADLQQQIESINNIFNTISEYLQELLEYCTNKDDFIKQGIFIVKYKLEGNVILLSQIKEGCRPEGLRNKENFVIEYIRRGLESQNIQFDF